MFLLLIPYRISYAFDAGVEIMISCDYHFSSLPVPYFVYTRCLEAILTFLAQCYQSIFIYGYKR